MTSVHISSGLALQRQMTSADNTSGPAPQRKERCTLQCTLSLKEEKSSYLRVVLSTTSTSGSTYISLYFNSLCALGPQIDSWIHQFMTRAKPSFSTPYVPPSKKDYEILFQPLFDEYRDVSLDPVAVAVVDPVGSTSSTTIDQDVPSASTSPTNQEIQ
ncbi:hypothetical protein Tco_1281072, partial [Tanacetum coccineum]